VLDVSGMASSFTLGSGVTLTVGRPTAPANDVLGPFTLGGGTINIGGTGTAATASFGGDLNLLNGGAMAFDLSNSATAGNDTVVVAGGLNLSNTTSLLINRTNVLLGSGNYPLFTYGTLMGTPSDSLTIVDPFVSARQTETITNTGNTVYLTVTGNAQALKWAGAAGSTWDNNTSNKVWTNASSSADYFATGDSVNFDNSNPNTAVNVNDAVNPAAIVITGSQNYVFSGPGTIIGASQLTMNGTGMATINMVGNTYTGGTVVNSGTLNLAWASNDGRGSLPAGQPVTVNSGATLRMAVGDAMGWYSGNPGMITVNGGIVTVAAGVHDSVGNGGFTLNGGTITSEGPGNVSPGNANYILDGTVFTVANSAASVINATGVQLRSGGTFNVAAGPGPVDLLVSSVLSGGMLIKDGAGNMVLSAANSYGNTRVLAGTLTMGSSAALPDTTWVDGSSSGKIELAGYSQTVAMLGGNPAITNSSTAAATLTVGYNDASGWDYGGTISGNMALAKIVPP
jgi:fibronectin-binding autotransporter adhesin